MIVTFENEIYDALAFRRGLSRAIRGVVRITAETGAKTNELATGWLITDSLVVISDFILTQMPSGGQTQYYCHLPTDIPKGSEGTQQGIPADPVEDLVPGKKGEKPALLRLREPAPPQCALSLKSDNLQKNAQILILHYPQGTPLPRLSIGRVVETHPSWLRYDASTQGGSSGGPILSPGDFSVAGMHVMGTREYNQGLSLGSIVGILQESSAWREIAEYHKLLDVSQARSSSMSIEEDAEDETTDETLLAAAVCWSFDPKSFPDAKREQLQALVNDPSAHRWTMRATERQNLIRSAGSLEELRRFRANGHAKDTKDKGQAVIDRILDGPPYKLDDVEDAALPYWLQAVRWFADVAPSLPTAAEVNRALERRRIKGRLQTTTGPDFRGREEQLDELKRWYGSVDEGPMVVSGIGGVGKSALVARFIQLLPDNPVVLWLDFDRADLAPDDAVSVLTLLSQQLSVQLDNFMISPVTATSWQKSAEEIGRALERQPPPVLVLDGFEVAQQVKQHNEIWEVLKLVLSAAHNLRILVSGRAPAMNVNLDERPTKQMHLQGMDAEDAKGWLRTRGITDEQVLQEVIEISEGVPLILLLALRLLEDGVAISDLPKDLPGALIQGFLYERILDRVLDPVLKPVAQDALVLRSLTEAMIPEVLHDRIPEGLTAGDVFSRLSLEMGLVGDQGDPRALSVLLPGKTNVLHLRPELRTATLKLLEKDAPQRVRTIDERAVKWYNQQDLTDVANAAELVYHNLRLGNIPAAEEAWLDSSALLLMYAEDDLAETATNERAWLHARVSPTETSSIAAWEKDVSERINNAISRGLLRVVPDLLKEHPERSKNSPLAIYDAWICWQNEDLEGARKALGPVGEIASMADRDRAVVAALLSATAGDRPEADRLLASVEDERWWVDGPELRGGPLGVRAARIRLAVDLKKELALTQILRSEPHLQYELQNYITATDIVLPVLSQELGGGWAFESVDARVYVRDVYGIVAQIERELSDFRKHATGVPIVGRGVSPTEPWRANDLTVPMTSSPAAELSQDLMVLSWRRWQLALERDFLNQAARIAALEDKQSCLALAIGSTLGAFHGMPLMGDADSYYFESLDQFLYDAVRTPRYVITPHSLSNERKALARQVWSEIYPDGPLPPDAFDARVQKKFLIRDSAPGTDYRLFVKSAAEKNAIAGDATTLSDGTVQILVTGTERRVDAFKSELTTVSNAAPDQIEEVNIVRDRFPMDFAMAVDRPDVVSILLYLLGPDPLEMLCRGVLHVPDSVT